VTFALFLQHLANGISLGSLYALVAVGYTIVYGILRLINFAHGDIFMMGAYFALFALSALALPWPIAFFLAIVATVLLGVIVEKIAYKPLREAPRMSAFISAVAMSFFLESFAIVVFGGRPKAFPRPEIFSAVIHIGGIAIQSITFFIIGVSIIAFLILTYLVYRTKMGIAMRALSKDFEIAMLMGIRIDQVVSFTFALGSSLAAVGAFMWGLKFPQLYPLMGVMPGIKAFIGAVLGGIGSIPGALLGGFCLGLTEIMLIAFLPGLAGFRDLFSYSLLILILLLRPGGIFGVQVIETKV